MRNAAPPTSPGGDPQCSTRRPALALALLALGLAACAGQPYGVPQDVSSAAFLERKITREIDALRVSVAVPDAGETAALFGLPLHERGVQPVWLQVHNDTPQQVRLSLWSIDPDYFSPLEVAWMHRGGFNKTGRAAMERWFYEHAMPRRIPAGESRSGFVYTQLQPGSKGMNLDFTSAHLRSFNFTFIVPMPGFIADYMTVDAEGLYAEDEIVDLTVETLRSALEALPCCSVDESGAHQGMPFNIALIGTRLAVRRALLRGGWQETAAGDSATAAARRQRYRNRHPDGTFVKVRADGSERKELRLWLTPLRVGDDRVWLGEIGYVLGDEDAGAGGYRIDPDISAAVRYLMQDFWYSQSLLRIGFIRVMEPVPAAAPRTAFAGVSYFTDGLRGVLWLSEQPVALDDTVNLAWELLQYEAK
ncbi:MAG: LssY C-terminal domain-containing protein [Rubrivivax sp.]|nr:LssY C-terminal domain-containing protein [Rubrivivax sp.]